jgi:hypothetical protein
MTKGVSKDNAMQLATEYAQEHDYSGVELRNESYILYGTVPAFAFYLLSNQGSEVPPSPTGLPEALFVDKVTGEVITDRALL